MQRFSTLAALALLAFTAGAEAHTHLKQSTPAEGSVLKAAPANIVLRFSEAARVTALSLQKEGEAAQKLTPLPGQPTAEVTVPAPKLSAGKYAVAWRVVSDDDHIMSGTVHFTVAPATQEPGTTPAH